MDTSQCAAQDAELQTPVNVESSDGNKTILDQDDGEDIRAASTQPEVEDRKMTIAGYRAMSKAFQEEVEKIDAEGTQKRYPWGE